MKPMLLSAFLPLTIRAPYNSTISSAYFLQLFNIRSFQVGTYFRHSPLGGGGGAVGTNPIAYTAAAVLPAWWGRGGR